MSLQIGAALKSGGQRLVSRTGALLTAGYAVLYVLYLNGYNTLLNALYARMGIEATLATPVTLPLPVSGVVVAVSLLGLSAVSVVATRTFVAGDRDAIPRDYYDGLVWAVPNLFVGGLVTMVLVSVGLVLLFVPGIFLLVSLAFLPMYVAVEGDNFVTAMRRSWGLARGDRLSVLGLVAVVTAMGFAIGIGFFALNLVATLAGYQAATPVIAAICIGPVTMYNLAAVSAAFEQLRDATAPTA